MLIELLEQSEIKHRAMQLARRESSAEYLAELQAWLDTTNPHKNRAVPESVPGSPSYRGALEVVYDFFVTNEKMAVDNPDRVRKPAELDFLVEHIVAIKAAKKRLLELFVPLRNFPDSYTEFIKRLEGMLEQMDVWEQDYYFQCDASFCDRLKDGTYKPIHDTSQANFAGSCGVGSLELVTLFGGKGLLASQLGTERNVPFEHTAGIAHELQAERQIPLRFTGQTYSCSCRMLCNEEPDFFLTCLCDNPQGGDGLGCTQLYRE